MYPELDVKVDTSVVLKTFLRLRNDFLPKQQMAMTGSVSNKTVGFAKNAFWRDHYNLKANKTDTVAIFGSPLPEAGATRLSKKRKKIITFDGYTWRDTTEFKKGKLAGRTVNRRLARTKTIYIRSSYTSLSKISSYPMNLYENDVQLGGWARGITRTGTHIMKNKMPGVVNSYLENSKQIFEQRIAAEVDK